MRCHLVKKITKKVRIVLQVFILCFFVVIANVSTTKEMTKVSNDASNRVINLSTMALKLEEDIQNDIYSAKDTYSGDITGYSADCPACTGRLSCASNYNVLRNGVTTYPDSVYGDVRIVASSSNLPCGSIVRFNLPSVSSEPIVAIVLDRGVLGNDLDLLMASEAEAVQYVGRKTLSYDVLREGWPP